MSKKRRSYKGKDGLKVVKKPGDPPNLTDLLGDEEIETRVPAKITVPKPSIDKSGGKTLREGYVGKMSPKTPEVITESPLGELATNLNIGITQEGKRFNTLKEKSYDPKAYFEQSGGMNPLAGLFSMSKQDTEDMRKREGKKMMFNAMGQGLRSIVDSYYVEQGATATPYNDDYFNRYIKKIDEADAQDYNLRQQLLQEAIRRIGRGETWEREDKVRAESREFSAEQAQLGREFSAEQSDVGRKFSAGQSQLGRDFSEKQTGKAQEFQIGRDKMTAATALKRLQETAKLGDITWDKRYDRMERIEIAKQTLRVNETAREGYMTLYDSKFIPRKIVTEGEANKIVAMIMQTEEGKNALDLIKPVFGETMTKEHKKYIVAKYWHLVEDQVMGISPQESEKTKNPYAYTGPGSRSQQTSIYRKDFDTLGIL